MPCSVHVLTDMLIMYVDAPVIAGSEGQQPFPFEIGSDYDIITCGLNLDTGPMLDGNPFPTVMWSFNGSTIANNSDKYTIDNNNLIVRNISRDDAGLYNCTATNMVGFDTIVYDVQTYGKVAMTMNMICCQNQIKVNFIKSSP